MPPVAQANAENPAPGFRQQVNLVCEWGILAVVLLILLWGPLAFGGIYPIGFLVIQALTIVALGLWGGRIWAQRPFRLCWPPMAWGVLVFLIYAFIRCHIVRIKYAAETDLIHVMVYAALFFIIVNNFHRRESAKIVALVLITLGMVLSWGAVFQLVTHHPTIWGVTRRAVDAHRGGATYINPNHFAGLLGMVVPLALALTLMSRFSPTVKVYLAYCTLAMLVGIGVSVSRGGIIAEGAALLVFCLALAFQRGYWVIGVGMIIGLLVVGLSIPAEFGSLQKRFAATNEAGHLSDIRNQYWPAAIQMFKENPLWGVGPGHFDSAFGKYRLPHAQIRPVYAHNDYLNTLGEWGAVGMAIIAASCLLLGYGTVRTWIGIRQVDLETTGSPKSDKSAFLMGACIGLLALLIHSLVDFNMHVPANAVVAITLMALISAHWRFATQRAWFNPHTIGKILMTAAIVAGMGWLCIQEVDRGREAFWLRRAADETAPVEERLADLKNAYAAEPSNYENAYNVGEYYRLTSQEGNPGYEKLAQQAMEWYSKSWAVNQLDAFVPMRYGMCLDWLGRTNESPSYFGLAAKMDPNNAELSYFEGRHFVELHDYPVAKDWFIHCLAMRWPDSNAVYMLTKVVDAMKEPNGLYK